MHDNDEEEDKKMVLEFSEQVPEKATVVAIIVMKILFVLTNMENHNGHENQPSLFFVCVCTRTRSYQLNNNGKLSSS